jgi:hypothetical protein
VYDDESERTPEFNIDYALEEVVTNNGGSPGPTPGQGGPPSSNAGASPPAPTATFMSPPPDARQYLDSDNDVTPRYRAVNDVIGSATTPGPIPREFEDELHLQIGEEPATYKEAAQHEPWRRAMQDEMDSILDNGTWRLETLPAGHRAIGLKWVYKVKKNSAGEIIKCKARLVAKGYVQHQGVDFEEVFAPVARIESVRLLLALATQEGWAVHHMDFKSAFLNGELQEEVYVKQPEGFAVEGQEHKVLRLAKALYGLRQDPRAWNAKLDQTLRALGFTNSNSEHAVYTRGHGSSRLLVGVYVDDLIITGSDASEIDTFKLQMQGQFKMSDLGLLSFYLGIEVLQREDGICISQSGYAR